MRVWLLKDGEHLPVQDGVSKMRTWMLAETLANRGHDVTWWSSTHSHQQKTCLFDADTDLQVEPGFTLRLLHCGGYERNVSLARVRHHRRLQHAFLRRAQSEPVPDALVAAFPLVEWADAAVRFAHDRRVRAVVDIRDPWPDVLVNVFRGPKRWAARLAFAPMRAIAARCLARADSVVSVSQGFLDWGMELAGRQQQPGDRVIHIGRPELAVESVSASWLEQLPSDRPIISFVGMFGKVYELELVCAAARVLASEPGGPVFVIAGAGDKSDAVSAMVAGLDNVLLPGWISRAEASALMQRSHAGLAPIRHVPGCLPNKIAEYLSHGLPIISSLEGDLPALMEQCRFGFSYSPGDLDGLVGAIRAMCAPGTAHAKMRSAARHLFETRFSAERVCADYADHLEALVSAQ